MRQKNYIGLLMAMYALVFMGDAQSSYLPLYLGSLGLDNAKIGAVLAAAPLIALCVQPLWGIIGDSASSKNVVVALMLVGSAVSYALIPLSHAILPLILFWIVVFYFFKSSLRGVMDSVTLEYLDTEKAPYGPIRLSGTVGYALMAMVMGWAAKRDMNAIFWLFCIPTLVGAFLMLKVPVVKGHYTKGSLKKIKPLLRQSDFIILMALVFVFNAVQGFYGVFYPVYYVKELGGEMGFLGIILGASAFAEIPFLIKSDALIHRFGEKNLLFSACFVASARWVLTSVVTDTRMQFFVQLLHGWNSIVFMVCVTLFINRIFPLEFKTSGQTFSMFVSQLASYIIGSLVGGVLCLRFSMQKLFLMNGVLLFAITLVLTFFGHKTRSKT